MDLSSTVSQFRIWTSHGSWRIGAFRPLTITAAYTMCSVMETPNLDLFVFFYVAFNTVQVISRRIVGRAEETSTYSWSGFFTVNCRPTASNYQLSHLWPCRQPNPGPQRWEARVLPLCHRGPHQISKDTRHPWTWFHYRVKPLTTGLTARVV